MCFEVASQIEFGVSKLAFDLKSTFKVKKKMQASCKWSRIEASSPPPFIALFNSFGADLVAPSILAQGSQWAAAVMQAFFREIRTTNRMPTWFVFSITSQV